MLIGVKPFQAYQHSKTPACPTCTLLPSPAHPSSIVVDVGVVTGVPDVNVVVGLVGGELEVVLVGVLVGDGGGVDVGVGVGVGDEELELQDTVKLT
jgi:hypothetical protein